MSNLIPVISVRDGCEAVAFSCRITTVDSDTATSAEEFDLGLLDCCQNTVDSNPGKISSLPRHHLPACQSRHVELRFTRASDLAVSRVGRVHIAGIASVRGAEERGGVDAVVGGRSADNVVLSARGEVVLAVDLILSAVLSRRASPDVNVADAVVIVVNALLANVFEATVLRQQWQINDLALAEFTRCGGDGEGVIVGSGAASGVATATVVRDVGTRRAVVGVAVEGDLVVVGHSAGSDSADEGSEDGSVLHFEMEE